MFVSQKPVAIILGGGAGTRLHPLTKDRSKPAVPIAGKYRLIDIPISNCLNSSIYHNFVLTQFNSGSLNQHISRSYPMPSFLDGFVEVLAATMTSESSNWYQGTADAVRQNLWYIRRVSRQLGAKVALVLSGDHLYRMDYRRLLAFHDERNADITVAVLLVPKEDVSGFGTLQVDNDLRIVRFVEKPKDDETINSLRVQGEFAGIKIPQDRPYLASMGIYVFNLDVLEEVLQNLEHNDFGKEVLPTALNHSRQMFAYPFNGYWRDIGTIRSYYHANLEMCAQVPAFDFFPNPSPFYTRERSLAPAKISGARCKHSLLAEGVQIAPGCKLTRSVIGTRSVLKENVFLQDTILFGNTRYEDSSLLGQIPMGIGEGSVLRSCIVDKDVRIGKKVFISGGDNLQNGDFSNYFIRDGLIIVPRRSVISDGTKIP